MAKRLGTSKDVEKAAKAARSQGWRVEITRGNHLKFVPPQKHLPIIILALTGCSRSDVNGLHSLRRAGLVL
jgi:hypothetical protein